MKNFFLTLMAFPFLTAFSACGALIGTTEDSVVMPLDSVLEQGAQKTGGYSIASSSCDAPDSTFAYSTQQTWKTYTYDLIFCWGAEEITTIDGGEALFLQKGDGSAWVQVVPMSGIPEKAIEEPIVEISEAGVTAYIYESYYTITTDAPQDNNVQDIIRTFTVTQAPSL